MYIKEGGIWKIAKAEYSYDAWGRMRDPATHETCAPGSGPALFLPRGYTGHEHLAWFGLVNMNARLYDATLGRFLSPDPYVQMPNFTQNFNRYSYCLNNPLVYVDEDGESLLLLIGGAILGGYLGGIATNKGELNPLQWNWKDVTTYLGVGVGAIFGCYTTYGFINPGSIGYTLGVNNAWASSSVTIGSAGFGSDWSVQWTTAAGGIGKISDKSPQNNIKMPAYREPNDDRFFNLDYSEAVRLLVFKSKKLGVETVMYYTDKGYYFEQTSGYVFGEMNNSPNSYMYKRYGTRGNGSPIYYAENSINGGILFNIRTHGSIEDNSYSIYLDLGMGYKYKIKEMYHTHPKNNYLSIDDPFQGVIPTYAIGWDGFKRGPAPKYGDSLLLDEIEIVAPTIK
ncbi:MAG: RHS repeat-associated core domain-containing protein [Fermentimonas sp.]